MEASPLSPERLAEDVVSLTRVRNRFSRTADAQLPKVMAALVPKLLYRLECYSQALQEQDDNLQSPIINDATTLKQMEKARQDIYGILAAAVERIRGNSAMPTGSLMTALLPFVGSANSVVGTWTLAFLQITIPRTTRESLDPDIFVTLIQTLGKLHHSLLSMGTSPVNEPATQYAQKSLESRWTTISWLILDFIMILSGQQPLLDWELEEFTPKSNIIERSDSDECRRIKDEANKALQTNGKGDNTSVQGLVALVLDVILFWPDQPSNAIASMSPIALSRMNHRSKSLYPQDADMEVGDNQISRIQHRRVANPHPGLPFQGRNRRRVPATSWTDMAKVYLRYVKATCVKFVVSPPHHGLFRDETTDSALLLSLCAANYDSMHGRMAIEYLNRFNEDKSHGISLPVAISIVILILGEEVARDLMLEFKSKSKQHCCWENLLGQSAENRELQRPPLPWDISLRAGKFLIDNQIAFSSGNEGDKRFLLQLCLELCQQNDRERKYLAIRIISSFCNDLSVENDESADILVAVTDVLQTVVDLGNSNLEEMREPHHPRGLHPLGVPAPFNHRNDLNRLLQTHRQSLKRKNMKRDDAMEARKEAYQLVPSLSCVALKAKNASVFQLPNLLLQCAVHEDSYLEHYVMKAIASVLSVYVCRMSTCGSVSREDTQAIVLSHQATSLLPSLLEAVCSEVVSARSIAMEWIEELLVKMDVEAALYLASFLVNDEDSHVASMARKFVSFRKVSGRTRFQQAATVEFHNMEEAESRKKISAQISNRVTELDMALNGSVDVSLKLLLHSGFSVSKAIADYHRDKNCLLEHNGLCIDSMETIDNAGADTVCQICYDNTMGTENFSLRCGHTFCRTCWQDYLKNGRGSKLAFLDSRCPHHECNVAVLRSDVREVCPDLLPRWDESYLNCFIERDPSHRYCPGPDCQCVAVSDTLFEGGPMKVTCKLCQTSFCFHCGETPHSPATCNDFAGWAKLKKSSRLWLKQNSKPCPGCDAPIEKNGGCNHVHCSSCQTDFCWICLALLNRHLEAHTCNRYDPVEKAEDDFERRALFTATRYEAHDHAEQFAAEQLSSFHPQKLLEAFWFLDEEHAGVFKNGLEIAVQSRCFLKHSYVALLGLRNELEALQSHESHHACLEMFTERLSQLLEMNLQRFHVEQGEKRMKNHFRRIEFYATSVRSYQNRILQLRNQSTDPLSDSHVGQRSSQ